MMTWMIVEDDQDIHDVLLAMIEIWGIEGRAFYSFDDVVEWIDRIDAGMTEPNMPTLAMIDIRLHDKSGIEVSARLRASPVLHNIAVVLITAYRMNATDEQRALLRSQADDLIYKPLPDPATLQSRLQHAMQSRRASNVR